MISFFYCDNLFSQTVSVLDSIKAAQEIYDPGEISNQIFLQTDDEAFGDQLQFLTDEFERIASHPLAIGTASRSDLLAIPTLTDLDISAILKSRSSGTPLTKEITGRLGTFMKTSEAAAKQHVFIRTRVVLDPEAYKESVYQSGHYQGSPLKTTSRLIAKSDDILFSMTEAKNPGEPLYFDHLTGCVATNHLFAITDDIAISQCVLGDYSLSYGSGLLFSNGSSQLPAKDIHSAVEPHSLGIAPYISSSSSRYFQGAASTVTAGMFSAGGFFSDRKIDATLDSSTKNILTLPTTIYHRTTAEIAGKNQAESTVAGGHFAFTPFDDVAHLEIGATGYSLNYDRPVIDTLANGFHGQKHSMISAEIRAGLSAISINGEYARMISDAGKADAFAASLVAQPLKFWELSMNYHYLPSNFISPFGSTFGINSATSQNEKALYLGSKFEVLSNKLSLYGAANISESKSMTNGNEKYSDIRAGAKFRMSSIPLRLSAEIRSYGKGPVFSVSNDSLSKNTFRFDVESNVTETMSISFRAEIQRNFSTADSIIKIGYLYGAKLAYVPLADISFSSEISFFSTDSYSSRFYANETDLTGSAPYTALYKSGFRYHLQCSYDPFPSLTISCSLSQTRYATSPGSALGSKTSVGIQCDVAF